MELAQQIANGLIVGSLYVLIAMGLSLIFGILSIPHFAHGSVAIASGYICYVLVSNLNLNFFLSMIISMAIAFLVGVLIERITYRPVRKAPLINSFIIALGMVFVIDNLLAIIFGPHQLIVPTDYNQVYEIAGIRIASLRLYLLLTCVILMVLLYFFINRTKTGKAIRAVAQNSEASMVVGINTNRITSIVFGIGSALAAVAGVFIGALLAIFPTMGTNYIMKAFAVLILGGLGSFPGAIIGGMIIGVTESIGSAVLSSSYRDIFAFVIMIIILIFKPQGLFGGKE